MTTLLDAFWRAALYCLHPRVIWLSLLPLLFLVAGTWLLAYFFWDSAVALVLQTLDAHPIAGQVLTWLESWGFGRIRAVIGPALVLFVSIPVMVLVTLLTVAAFMVPALTRLVGERRFPLLEKKRGGTFWMSCLWSLGATALAVLLTVLSWPLWFFPPLALLIPPLIWGWLTYRVMAFDVLAEYASVQERHELMADNRLALLGMGIVTGYLGTAPALIWASGAMWVAMAPIVLPVAIWLYTLAFAFSGLWFAHYALAALERLRLPGGAQPSASARRDDDVVDVQAKTVSPSTTPTASLSNNAPQG